MISNLLWIARGDLDDARRLATGASRNAIYLCEQAAEKVILAVQAFGVDLNKPNARAARPGPIRKA